MFPIGENVQGGVTKAPSSQRDESRSSLNSQAQEFRNSTTFVSNADNAQCSGGHDASAIAAGQVEFRYRLNQEAQAFRSGIATTSSAEVRDSDFPDLPASAAVTNIPREADEGDFKMRIATKRLENLESCSAIARDLGIWRDGDRFELEMSAVCGPAGIRVVNGESCLAVAEKFGIFFEETRLALQMAAVDGLAGQYAKIRGESCAAIASRHNIVLPEARLALEMMAVNGRAGVRVRNGEGWQQVAMDHGIEHAHARRALQEMANPGRRDIYG